MPPGARSNVSLARPVVLTRPHADRRPAEPDGELWSAQSQFPAQNVGRDLLSQAASRKRPRPDQREGVGDTAPALL